MKISQSLITMAKELEQEFEKSERISWTFIEKREDFWSKVFRQAEIKPLKHKNYVISEDWELLEVAKV